MPDDFRKTWLVEQVKKTPPGGLGGDRRPGAGPVFGGQHVPIRRLRGIALWGHAVLRPLDGKDCLQVGRWTFCRAGPDAIDTVPYCSGSSAEGRSPEAL